MCSDVSRSSVPVARKVPFDFPENLNPNWIPSDPEFTAMVNAVSIIMPYLEPFLIQAVRDVIAQVSDANVVTQGKALNHQEQIHYQVHRRFNAVLKNNGYPELAEIEKIIQARYQRLSQCSLQTRMAYGAGFESMTLGVTKWLVTQRVKLFANADPRVVSFILWHMVEETEHKFVAFDVYQARYGTGLKSWAHRMFGVFYGSLDVVRLTIYGYHSILRQNGLWRSPRSRLKLQWRIFQAWGHILPFIVRAAMPWHNPRQESDPEWVREWLAGYAEAPEGYVPMIDTQHPQMPVPF